MTTVLNKNTDYNNTNILYQEIKGGLGNQVCLLLNILSLASKYNMNYVISLNRKFSKLILQKYKFLKILNLKKI